MYKLIILFAIALMLGCQKTELEICHNTDEFYATNPIPMDSVFTLGFTVVGCNVYRMDVTYYSGRFERIFMNYNHQVIREQ
jgi:hypothetical protein